MLKLTEFSRGGLRPPVQRREDRKNPQTEKNHSERETEQSTLSIRESTVISPEEITTGLIEGIVKPSRSVSPPEEVKLTNRDTKMTNRKKL